MKRLATIDVGTNTTLLLIAEERDGQIVVLEDRAEITRLGRGIGSDGRLGQEGIDRTLGVLSGYAVLARVHEAPIFAIGTEALRRAPNAADFLNRAAALLDTPIEVIAGDREAALTTLAAKQSFPEQAKQSMVVIDIGGGSTEIIVARNGRADFSRSLPLGSVRLTERHVRHDPPLASEIEAVAAEVDGLLTDIPFPAETERACLVGTAGTVTTLAAMAQELKSYDARLVHGYRMSLSALQQQIDRLARSTQAERQGMAGLDPRRADVIMAGGIILSRIGQRVGGGEILVSDRGIRWGLLLEKLGVSC